jgi:glutamyl-tRNA reductase
MNLLLVGTSHRLAPVEVRERVAVDVEGAAALGARLGESGEAVCLSTCNRTEVYLAAADAHEADRRATEALAELAGFDGGELEPYLYRLEQEAAAVHLFRVAAGLDSLVPGEGEILGQVRAAYEHGTVGPLLDRLFSHALHAGKRVRAETAIGESPASVASAAAALAAQVFGDLAGRRILVIGAGKVGEVAARNLVGRGAELSFVANRTLDRASTLAGRFGATAVPLDEVGGELAAADIVVSSTSAPGVVLDRDQVSRVLPQRRGRPLLLVDLAVPRDLEPEINDLPGCFLYDIDDLEAVVEESLTGRRGEASKAEAIVVAEGARFHDWLASLDVVPAIASIRERAESIRRGELAKASSRLAGLSERERNAVESLTSQIVNKLLHQPIVRLKEAAAADGVRYVETARDLFGLRDDDERRGPEDRFQR